MENKKEQLIWGLLRLAMGWTFLWAFFDKVFGLGFATCRDAKTLVVDVMCQKAWVNGGSPTMGFLKFGTKGPLADFYQGLAGSALVDNLFMAGLFLIGLSLILGVGVRIASISGITMLLLMYSAAMLPENNPFLDDHIIYSLVMIGFIFTNAGDYLGLGKKWSNIELVKKYSFLK